LSLSTSVQDIIGYKPCIVTLTTLTDIELHRAGLSPNSITPTLRQSRPDLYRTLSKPSRHGFMVRVLHCYWNFPARKCRWKSA